MRYKKNNKKVALTGMPTEITEVSSRTERASLCVITRNGSREEFSLRANRKRANDGCGWIVSFHFSIPRHECDYAPPSQAFWHFVGVCGVWRDEIPDSLSSRSTPPSRVIDRSFQESRGKQTFIVNSLSDCSRCRSLLEWLICREGVEVIARNYNNLKLDECDVPFGSAQHTHSVITPNPFWVGKFLALMNSFLIWMAKQHRQSLHFK